MRAIRWPRFSVRRAARALVVAVALASPGIAASAQSSTPAAPHAIKHHKRHAAAAKTTATAQPAVPVAPPAPNWPVNSAPTHAAVSWDSRSLRIEASNSSLLAILADVSSATGTKIEGISSDLRIFGSYGPGSARDVLSQLFQGLGYNVLMMGESALGVPREVQLSMRGGGGSTLPAPAVMGRPQPQPMPDDDTMDDTPEPEPEPPLPPQGNPPVSPQDQQRQQLLQQGQQPGQPPQQPNN